MEEFEVPNFTSNSVYRFDSDDWVAFITKNDLADYPGCLSAYLRHLKKNHVPGNRETHFEKFANYTTLAIGDDANCVLKVRFDNWWEAIEKEEPRALNHKLKKRFKVMIKANTIATAINIVKDWEQILFLLILRILIKAKISFQSLFELCGALKVLGEPEPFNEIEEKYFRRVLRNESKIFQKRGIV